MILTWCLQEMNSRTIMKNFTQLESQLSPIEISRRTLLTNLIGAIGISNYWIKLATTSSNVQEVSLKTSLRFIDIFYESMIKNYIADWENLFISASELAGAKPGTYIGEDGSARSIKEFFISTTIESNISRLAKSLDVACAQAMDDSDSAKVLYYEFGQLLASMYYWLISTTNGGQDNSILDSYPNLKIYFEQYQPLVSNWPFRMLLTID